MNYWIVPSNENKFNIAKFMELHDNEVDWKQSADFEVGDVAYIYCTKPQMRIRYKMEVIATDIPFGKSMKDESCWTDKTEYKSGVENNKYFRMRLVISTQSNLLTMDELHKHGIDGWIQRPRKISSNVAHFIETSIIKSESL